MKRPVLRHRIEYAGIAAAALAARALGARGANAVGRALGRFARWPVGVRRAVVETHLRAAFPDRPERWVQETAAAAYAHFGAEAMMLLRLMRAEPAELLRRTEVTGLTEVQQALQEGRGAVLVTGHLGNWEIAGASLAVRAIPMDAIAQSQENPLFERAIQAMRHRFGLRIIDRRRATPQALRSLRAGRVVAFVADQDAWRHGVFVPFFGRPASTHRGPALLALRTGAPVFAGAALRTGDRYVLRLVRIPGAQAGSAPEEAVRQITSAFTAFLETAARKAPEQYFWFHRRWKTQPPTEQPGGADGILPGGHTS